VKFRVEDFNKEKKIIKIVDVFGRKSKPNPNVSLFIFIKMEL